MKMIAINGSPHPRGEVWKRLRKVQIEVPELKIVNLTGKDDRTRKEFREQALQEVNDADLVVFATPVYWFNVSALMKEFLEHLEEADEYPLQDKIAYLIAVGNEDGCQQAINQMFGPLSHMGFWFPPYASLFVNTSMPRGGERGWQHKIPQDVARELKRLSTVFEAIRNAPDECPVATARGRKSNRGSKRGRGRPVSH